MTCPHCQNDDSTLQEVIVTTKLFIVVICEVCSKSFQVSKVEVDDRKR